MLDAKAVVATAWLACPYRDSVIGSCTFVFVGFFCTGDFFFFMEPISPGGKEKKCVFIFFVAAVCRNFGILSKSSYLFCQILF